MRRLIVIVVVLTLLGAIAAPAAHAGSAAVNVALGLAAFAVFNQLVGATYAHAWPRYVYPTTVVYTTPAVQPYPYVVYTSPQTIVAPAPAIQRIVEFPHGRYELRGDGVTTAYQWIWIPKVPPVPPPPPAQ